MQIAVLTFVAFNELGSHVDRAIATITPFLDAPPPIEAAD